MALRSGLGQLASFRTETTGPEVAQSLLRLVVLQAQSNPDESSAKNALEPAVAAYLAFQAALPRDGSSSRSHISWCSACQADVDVLQHGCSWMPAWSRWQRCRMKSTTKLRSVRFAAFLRHARTERYRKRRRLLCSSNCYRPPCSSYFRGRRVRDRAIHRVNAHELTPTHAGSGRVATAALAEILRDVAVVASRMSETAAAPACYLAISRFLDSLCAERVSLSGSHCGLILTLTRSFTDQPLLLSRLNISAVLSLIAICLRPGVAETTFTSSLAGDTLRHFVAATGHIVRHRKDHLVSLFPALIAVMSGFLAVLRIGGLGSLGTSALLDDASDTSIILGQRAEREAKETFPAWVWAGGRRAIGRNEAKAVSRLLGSLGAKTTTTSGGTKRRTTAADLGASTTSLMAPLSKHAPFLLLNYLRACVHPTCPIPSALRSELQGGWFEVMDAMGKWEREALMKGLLGDEEEAERGVLRSMWAAWEKERYRG